MAVSGGTGSMAGRRALVVDDDRITRSVLTHMLRSEGFEVIEAEDGEGALEEAERDRIDAFLLDIRMPGIGGIELCRRLRAQPRYRMTPILFVTALDEQSNLAEAFEAGCDDFINKPVNPVVLKARLHGHLTKMDYYFQLERVRENLNRYISPRTQEVVEQYSATGDLPPPTERQVCVLFSDIRGFTALAQDVDTTFLFEMLSRHLGDQVDRVYAYGGYVDKFGGDGVMAVFDGDEMAVRSCLCALDILDAAHNNHTDDGGALIKPGIGIHLGRALIGNIGSTEHLDYSVVGDTVNLAARLCGHAHPLTAVVSQRVREGVGEETRLAFTDEHAAQIRGFKQPVTVYHLERGR